jgi:serine protease inhibitor ecotin
MILTSLAIALLASSSSVAASGQPEDPLDKIVCKRSAETGSLIKGKKVCLTRREWNKIADNARAMGQQMQDDNSRIIGGQ